MVAGVAAASRPYLRFEQDDQALTYRTLQQHMQLAIAQAQNSTTCLHVRTTAHSAAIGTRNCETGLQEAAAAADPAFNTRTHGQPITHLIRHRPSSKITNVSDEDE